MLYIAFLIKILYILCQAIPVLLSVAFITVAERKTMASMQRRIGPNTVGFHGTLQAIADALKLLIKEFIAPTQANIVLFFLGPIITLIFSLVGYTMIPYGPGIAISDYRLGILFVLAVSSLATYGILLAGWSANSKYAFLGSLRSTAQLISYELILSSGLLLIIILSSTFNLTIMIEIQKTVWFIFLVFPLYMIFFISAVAETNRAPFDLAEAESELVSGFMTEHSAGIFVFFFLGEYASVILMCYFISNILIGGYEVFNILYLLHLPLMFFNNVFYFWDFFALYPEWYSENIKYGGLTTSNTLFVENHSKNLTLSLLYASCISIKTLFLVFLFIWVRASYPRLRFDQLMAYCWTNLLPIIIAIILFEPSLLSYNRTFLPVL